MNAITLRVKNAPGFRVDGSKLLPAALAAVSPAELPRIELQGAGE
jgi:formylmethanofuran dehydrogenase subunit C